MISRSGSFSILKYFSVTGVWKCSKEAWEVGQVTKSLVGHGKDFGLYPPGNEKNHWIFFICEFKNEPSGSYNIKNICEIETGLEFPQGYEVGPR